VIGSGSDVSLGSGRGDYIIFAPSTRVGGCAVGSGVGTHRDLDVVAAEDLAEEREAIAHGRLGPVETRAGCHCPLAAHPLGGEIS
jgi:hypothetical protein